MTKVNIQFHALPIENIDFIKMWMKDFNLHIVSNNRKKNISKILLTESDLEKIDFSETQSFYLCLEEPIIQENTEIDFLEINSDLLSFRIGKNNDDVLEESILSTTKTENSNMNKIWKKIIKDLKNNTFTGMWVVNPYTGSKSYYKDCRYTKGAKKISEEGKKIVPSVGWNYYLIEADKS